MSGAERQARYRERQKSARHVTVEAAVEAARCRLAAEFVQDAEDDAAMSEAAPDAAAERVARIRDVTARPLWPEGEFDAWLDRVLVREIEDQISAARRERRGQGVRRRAGAN